MPPVSAKRAFIALPKVLRQGNMKFRSFFGSFFYIQQTKNILVKSGSNVLDAKPSMKKMKQILKTMHC